MSKVRVVLPSQDDADSEGAGASAVALSRASQSMRLVESIKQHLRWRPGKSAESKRKAWVRGATWELDFWGAFLEGRDGDSRADFLERMDPDLPLQEILAQLIVVPDGETVRILDVGAGPFTFIGRKSPRWPLEIVAIDPLADGYDMLLAEHNVRPPVRTRSIAAEDLLSAFSPDSFDLVCARNSLDHALDPARAIRQMMVLVKPGGSISLQHLTYEAERNLYTGMHQWNLYLENGDFMLAGASGITNITQMLGDRAVVKNTLFEDKWLVTAITRLS